jgi:hypothetical protein
MNTHDKVLSSFFLKFKEGSKEEVIFFEAVAGLKSIPNVLNFEVLKQISPKIRFDYGLGMEFTTLEVCKIILNTSHIPHW